MQTIFDSSIALQMQQKAGVDYYLSDGFRVVAGEKAHLILTAHLSGYEKLLFEVLRPPSPMTKEDCTSDLTGIFSRLRNTPPNKPMSNPWSGSAYRRKKASQDKVVLGNRSQEDGSDPVIYDYVTISRPGNYILFAPEKFNTQILDTTQPTIIECWIEKKCYS